MSVCMDAREVCLAFLVYRYICILRYVYMYIYINIVLYLQIVRVESSVPVNANARKIRLRTFLNYIYIYVYVCTYKSMEKYMYIHIYYISYLQIIGVQPSVPMNADTREIRLGLRVCVERLRPRENVVLVVVKSERI